MGRIGYFIYLFGESPGELSILQHLIESGADQLLTSSLGGEGLYIHKRDEGPAVLAKRLRGGNMMSGKAP